MERAIARNESSWAWDDDSNIRVATVYLDDSNGRLRFEITETHIKHGLGAGKRSQTLVDIPLGTVSKPDIKKAINLLKRNSHSRSRGSSPFSRRWEDKSGTGRTLGDIITDYAGEVSDGSGDEDRKRKMLKKKLDYLSGDELDKVMRALGIRASVGASINRFPDESGEEMIIRKFMEYAMEKFHQDKLYKASELLQKAAAEASSLGYRNFHRRLKKLALDIENVADARLRVRQEVDKLDRVNERELRSSDKVAADHDYKVGDILYSSWGYDQTNIDFYEVVGVTSKSIKIRKVANKTVKSNGPDDFVVPVKGRFIESPMTKRVKSRGEVKIESYAWAYPWDGKPKRQTAAGWGH